MAIENPTPARPELAACHYCGLPTHFAAGAEPVYCCYGCRFAEHVTGAQGVEGANRATLARLGIAIFFTMNVIAFSMALWVQDHDGVRNDALAQSLWGMLRYLCLLFSLPVVFLLGGPLLDSALENLAARRITMDALLVVGVFASLVYSVLSAITDQGHVYFEVTCAILVLVTLGKWLEAEGKRKTTEALEGLSRLLPEKVRVLRADQELEIPATAVVTGDRIHTLAGEIIATDGTVVRGSSAVDQQVLTGESAPALKRVGDDVLGGTLCLDGDLVIEATTTLRGGSLQRLIDLVRQAARSKGRYERLADRVSALFVPAVMVIAAGTCIYHSLYTDVGFGIRAALGVLVIACPCALGLATPMATWAAMGNAARHQVVFQNALALEKLAEVRAIRFDKTGTLTSGQAALLEYSATASDPEMALARELACCSVHPLAVAVAENLTVSVGYPPVIVQTRTVAGLGIEGQTTRGVTARLGSLRFLEEGGFMLQDPSLGTAYQAAKDKGHSVVCFGHANLVKAVFVCSESLREESKPVIASLRAGGYDLGVLTGDHAARGVRLAQELEVRVIAELFPEGKVAAIDEARQALGPVAMVGDGVNDAPALARADVGIALGCGTDLTRSTADVCLLSSDLRRLPWTLVLARRTVRVIRENLVWAFSYNILAIGIAVTGRLNPVIAAVAMLVSSFLVVGNSLRLTRAPLESVAASETPPAKVVQKAREATPLAGPVAPVEVGN